MSDLKLPVRVALLSLVVSLIGCGGHDRTSHTPDDAFSGTQDSASAGMTPASGDKTPRPTSEPAIAPTPMFETPEGGAKDGPAASPAAVTPLTAGQIAMITELANKAEIEQGKLAQGRAKSADVKKYAAMMVKHHGDAQNQQAKLYKQLNITATESQQATTLKEDADRALTALRAAGGTAFDVEYIDGQVAAHEKVLATINQQLLPAASDPKLVDGLNEMKAKVEAHLQEAKTLQTKLNQGPTGGGLGSP